MKTVQWGVATPSGSLLEKQENELELIRPFDMGVAIVHLEACLTSHFS